MYGYGCAFGADPASAGGVDPAAVAAVTVKDSIGLTYWKPEVMNAIQAALPELWVVNEQSSDPTGLMQAVRVANLGLRSDVPSSAATPMSAAGWYSAAVGAAQSVLASYGMVWPGGGLQRYLFAVPDSIEVLKQASALAPILTLSPSAFAAINAQLQVVGGSPTGLSAWWSARSGLQKVAIVGGGILVLGTATGMLKLGKRRRKSPSAL
jgi:hypothetical protein